jgi:hypothetical protein
MEKFICCLNCGLPCKLIHDLDLSECCYTKTALGPDVIMEIRKCWEQYKHLDKLLNDATWFDEMSPQHKCLFDCWQAVRAISYMDELREKEGAKMVRLSEISARKFLKDAGAAIKGDPL